MATEPSQQRVPEPAAIPDRLYFKIGDVARICGVETYVLRFWESRFPQLKPRKTGTGQRLYRRPEVELALRIRQLVHEQGYTLAGARQVIASAALESAPSGRPSSAQSHPASPAAGLESGLESGPALSPDKQSPAQNPSRLQIDTEVRLDNAAQALGRARAELRELVGLLAAPDPLATVNPIRKQHPQPRRPAPISREKTLTEKSGSLFPA